MNRRWLAIAPKEYFELPAYGSGALRCFARSGQLVFYHEYLMQDREESDSGAQRLGRAFHAAMEDENAWRERYAVIPTKIEQDEFYDAVRAEEHGGKSLALGDEINLRLKSHKLYMQAHKDRAAREGKDFVTETELEIVYGQVSAVYDNPAVRELLHEKREFNVEATCLLEHDSGITLKALVDLPLQSQNVDFKTTRHRIPVEFIRDAYKRGYDWQAGHYALVTGKRDFSFVSVTNCPPFEANLFTVPRQVVNGRAKEIERHCYQLALLLNDEISEKDSQGIPYSFHSELWGTAIPLETEYMGRS